MNIRLAGKCTVDSIVDGPGLRIVVWTQGCPHHCPNCHNPQTHDYNGGYVEDTEVIVELLDKAQLQSGLTFSGGEPFEQPLPLIEIAKEAKKRKLNIWVYTGYSFETLIKNEEAYKLLTMIDVLVDGRFIENQKHHALKFKGSLNQRIINVPASLREKRVIISSYDQENEQLKG